MEEFGVVRFPGLLTAQLRLRLTGQLDSLLSNQRLASKLASFLVEVHLSPFERREETVRPNEALDSTDRSVVAALLSTSARPVNKSSANEPEPQR